MFSPASQPLTTSGLRKTFDEASKFQPKDVLVQRDEFIRGFFKSIGLQLPQATIKEHTVRYHGSEVAAQWVDGLWEVQLGNESVEESIQRFYDPALANSPDSAARYFVETLRRMNGEEVPPKPQVVRTFRKPAKDIT